MNYETEPTFTFEFADIPDVAFFLFLIPDHFFYCAILARVGGSQGVKLYGGASRAFCELT
jgi:hypothetical protein